MLNKYLFYILSSVFILSFISCGTNDGKWGIDNKSGILLPICNGDKNTTTNAMKLISGYTLEPLLEDTNILIWHFSNSDKLACVSTGKAIMKEF